MSTIQGNTATRRFFATLLIVCCTALALARPGWAGGARAGASPPVDPSAPSFRAAGPAGGDDRCRVAPGVVFTGDDILRWGLTTGCGLVRVSVGVLDLTRSYVGDVTALIFARHGAPGPAACGGPELADTTGKGAATPAPETAGRCRSW